MDLVMKSTGQMTFSFGDIHTLRWRVPLIVRVTHSPEIQNVKEMLKLDCIS